MIGKEELSVNDKKVYNAVMESALTNVKENIFGVGHFVRVKAYKEAISELTLTGKTVLPLTGVHYFNSSNEDEEYNSNNIELFSFTENDTDVEQSFFDNAEKEISKKVLLWLF